MKNKPLGKCALCRREGELSFEHIPPESAFNSSPARPVSGDEFIGNDYNLPWDLSGLCFDNQQSGMGKWSLCQTCNNNTGAWYGNDYKKMAHIISHVLQQPYDSILQGVGIKDIYPLRFIKQVLSMFCSINNFDDERIHLLRQFVLHRAAIGLDKSKYKLCMYFTKSQMMKYAGLSVVIKRNTGTTLAISEISAYPLGFILYFDPTDTWEYDGLDITEWGDYSYDDCCDVQMPLPILEINSWFIADFRSKEEIIKQSGKRLDKHEL